MLKKKNVNQYINKNIMKNKIMFCLALLFVSINGFCQKDSGTAKAGWYLDTANIKFGIISGYYDSSFVVIKYDTVKVIMLVCDTNKKVLNYNTGSGEISIMVFKSPYGGLVYWQFGYKVMKFIPAGWGAYDNQIYPHWEFEGYLDQEKQPLNKNTVVWISINQ